MNQKLKILILFVCVLSFAKLKAQPNWSVNPVNFNYSMSYVGIVYLDNNKMADQNSKIAAFVGEEVRGVTSPVYDEKTKNWNFYLLCYSNINGQTLTFKYYNSTNNETIVFDKTNFFEADAIKGSPFNPNIWAKPELVDAELIKFDIINQVYSEIVDYNVNIVVSETEDVTKQIATFEVSAGALVMINDEIQVSGVTQNDFSSPLIYKIISADNSTENLYVVNIIKDDLKNLVATEIISPNNDGFNDFWNIENVEKYKNSHFYIYTNTGQIVFESTGYNNDWDGTYKGSQLPIGVYYYVIKDTKCSDCKLVGTISLVK